MLYKVNIETTHVIDTPVVIADFLHKIISDWKLEDCIFLITTENGTNMVAKAAD
jgi:hypothetical protein